jgi:ABC-type transport system involved in cytochrome bd biosynthesis fused ATPase/permease subunit
MDSVVMSYRAGLPPVLKGISLSVKGGEKVGVIGRTGAGSKLAFEPDSVGHSLKRRKLTAFHGDCAESSIMSALFRLVELTSGSISIDGLDISTLGLRDLRRNVIIIPQDAGLFSVSFFCPLSFPYPRYEANACVAFSLPYRARSGPTSIRLARTMMPVRVSPSLLHIFNYLCSSADSLLSNLLSIS